MRCKLQLFRHETSWIEVCRSFVSHLVTVLLEAKAEARGTQQMGWWKKSTQITCRPGLGNERTSWSALPRLTVLDKFKMIGQNDRGNDTRNDRRNDRQMREIPVAISTNVPELFTVILKIIQYSNYECVSVHCHFDILVHSYGFVNVIYKNVKRNNDQINQRS
jgi:hypothetical protein